MKINKTLQSENRRKDKKYRLLSFTAQQKFLCSLITLLNDVSVYIRKPDHPQKDLIYFTTSQVNDLN